LARAEVQSSAERAAAAVAGPARAQLTFKGNRGRGRHDWLRLTPAYSVGMVEQILDRESIGPGKLLDPFCGSGTTALVCAERGIRADTTDINPFLLWLAEAKARSYSATDRRSFVRSADLVARALSAKRRSADWVPALYRIEKWWSADTLAALSRGFAAIRTLEAETAVPVVDLLKIAFCRTMIARAHVSFGHQSMSFRKARAEVDPRRALELAWASSVELVTDGAAQPVIAPPRALLCDARELGSALRPNSYTAVITSPPYPNRMSYVRELRPYMYWLGYLDSGKSAGALDWQAIGGTWGSATSNLSKWAPASRAKIPFAGFERRILGGIAKTSPLLATYVHKYFDDMRRHCRSLYGLMRSGSSVHYIVGNSKFYDVVLPVERIFAALFEAAGFRDPEVRAIRKRSSKKELYEFVVSARKD
jgi:hypothetical protein